MQGFASGAASAQGHGLCAAHLSSEISEMEAKDLYRELFKARRFVPDAYQTGGPGVALGAGGGGGGGGGGAGAGAGGGTAAGAAPRWPAVQLLPAIKLLFVTPEKLAASTTLADALR